MPHRHISVASHHQILPSPNSSLKNGIRFWHSLSKAYSAQGTWNAFVAVEPFDAGFRRENWQWQDSKSIDETKATLKNLPDGKIRQRRALDKGAARRNKTTGIIPAKLEKMFGFFKNLFGNHVVGDPVNTSVAPSVVPSVSTKSAMPKAAPKPAFNNSNSHVNGKDYANGNGNGRGNGNGHENANGHAKSANEIQLFLQPILDGLPVELRRKALHADLGRMMVSVPVGKILPQLSRGMVKITFGELRAAAPGVFVPQTDRDSVELVLPLAEILSQINPTLLNRRTTQNQVQVPEDVSGPFGSNGEGLIFAVGRDKVEPLKPAPQRSVTPPNLPAANPTLIPNRNIFMSVNPPTPPAAAPVSMPVPPKATELPALRMATPQPTPGIALPPKPAAPLSVPPPAPVIPDAPIAFKPIVPTVTEAKPAAEEEVLMVPLATLAGGWPETVRGDIVRLNLMSAKLALPVSAVEPALKRGRIPFKWGVLRSWAKPAPMLNMSPHDDVVVELPLDAIAPLFFERQRNLVPKRVKVAIDETIPDLFFGFPQPESLTAPDSHAVTKPSDTNLLGKLQIEPAQPAFNPTDAQSENKSSDTNYYVWNEGSDTARLDRVETIPAKLDTAFIKRGPTPKDVVTRAAALENVAGALVALPDGLLVAGHIPPDLNGDTLAGFIPQIFNKVNQASNELRMGELNNLAFTVGNVPWKIFRVNAVFFAAFGRAGEQMPTAQLAALAAELDQKNR